MTRAFPPLVKKEIMEKVGKMRYAGMTFEEIGRALSVTRQRAHQLFKEYESKSIAV